MIPRQATATKLSWIRNRRVRLCTYSIESMAISSWVKPELNELKNDLQSEKVEISVGRVELAVIRFISIFHNPI
jgi:hypothetical protein